MKTTFIKSIAIIAAVAFVAAVDAHGEAIHDCGPVYDSAYVPPGFINIEKYWEKNIRYPKEAWKEQRMWTVGVQATICRDGSMTDIIFNNPDIHPALKEELLRVFGSMKWYPAAEKGQNVSVRYNFEVPLKREYGSYTSPAPLGLEDCYNDGIKCAAKFNKPSNTFSQDEINAGMETMGETIELFPELALTAITYGRLLNRDSKRDKAQQVLDNSLSKYHKYYRNRDSLLSSPDYHYPDVIRPYWDGRTEVGIAVMRALLHDTNDSKEKDAAYNCAMGFIDRRIIDGDVSRLKSAKAIAESEDRIRRMRNDMVMEFSHGRAMIDRNGPNWQNVTRLYSVGEISNSLGYWANRGEFNNAQVAQLTKLIEQERSDIICGKKAKGEVRHLFGAKAFLIWMREGKDGFERYVAVIKGESASKQLVKYLEKMEREMEKNATVLADREAVLESIACLIPPQNATGQEREEFYARRKAAEKVFPLKWMLK